MNLTRIQEFFLKKPTSWDVLWMSLFTVFITGQPLFMRHEIIMMEAGIHLPAINALFHGLVPYRDFFFLRGPMELYVPALMMKIFGVSSALLPVFYYVGTMATLILCVIIAGQLLQSRFIFYMMVPAFVARTFPRIAYYYWGGMRYAMGFLVILCLFYFFKTRRNFWIFLTGLTAGLAFLTTAEAGISTIAASVAALGFAALFGVIEWRSAVKSFLLFCLGLLVTIGPFFIYLAVNGAFAAYVECNLVVIKYNHVVFPGTEYQLPAGFMGFLTAFWIGLQKFEYASPLFCYIFFAGYLVYRFFQKKLNRTDAFMAGLAVYGFILYAMAFRKIEGHHFEMALQAEKFLYFFLAEFAVLYFWLNNAKRWHKKAAYGLAAVILISSLGYAFQRFDHRFTMFKLIKKNVFHSKKVKSLSFLDGMETSEPTVPRARGHVVPRWQAEEIDGVVAFLQSHTGPDEAVFCFPEVGNFNFWADRPFVGRFPIATFSWHYQPLHDQMVEDFKKAHPRYVVMTNLGHRTFPAKWYFRVESNVRNFNHVTQLILKNYDPVKSFESVSIYQIKPSRESLVE